jgi:uncharacterized protein
MNYQIAEHRIIRTRESNFLFLVGEKAIFEMDPLTDGFVTEWSQREAFDLKENYSGVADLTELERLDFIKGLLRRRVIVPARNSVAGTVQDRMPATTIPIKTLIVHVTDTCNLDCGYCYERNGHAKPGKGQCISQETANRAVDFLLARAGALTELVIVFFGGEPLLNFPVIEQTVTYARQQADRAGKRVDFALTTNGTLLSSKIIDFLRANRISVTVSMDGCGKDHDRFRRFKDGRPSYDLVKKKIGGLLNPGSTRPVVARVTLTRGYADVSATLDHLFELGFVEGGFAPVTSGQAEFQLTAEDMNRLLKQFGALSQRFINAVLAGSFLGFSNIIDLLVSLHQGQVMNYPCGAGLGLFSVGTDGNLYLCQRFTGNEQYCMGSVFDGFRLDKLESFRDEARIGNKADCRVCWARTVCTGGCYHEACVREGSHLKPNRHYCEWIKQWTATGLEIYCQLASKRPDFLDMLSASRGYAH